MISTVFFEAPPTLAKSAKAREVTFDASFGDKFKELVIGHGVAAELQQAYKYVADLPPMKPAGIASAIRTLEEVKKLTKARSTTVASNTS